MSTQVIEYDSRTGSSAGERKEVHVTTVQRLIYDALRKLPFATTTSVSGKIVLLEFEPFSSDASQAWVWTAEWQAGEREADAQKAAGLGDFFENSDELTRALKERRRRNG